MSRKPYLGPSESQSDALYRRDHSYTAASGRSFTIAWSWDKRQPRSLRDAADMLRRAYADEIPTKLHNQELADDGTPRMTPQAEGYIFGHATQTETTPRCDEACRKQGNDVPGQKTHLDECPASPANRPLWDYYRTPVRAALATLKTQSEERHDLIKWVATGTASPAAAAMGVGVPPWCAKIVAENVVFAFMRSLSDLKVSVPAEGAA